MIKIITILLLVSTISFATIKDKTTNDVYVQAEILKHKIIHLAGEQNINATYLKLPFQSNKSPRHVLQKTLEVIIKINKYREIYKLGEVNVPIYPSRRITSEDVYYNVKRLNSELDLLLKNVSCPHIKELSQEKEYNNKTSNDNYHEVWLASLAMDQLLGRGFSPVDTYQQSVLILDIIKYIRSSQGIYEEIEKPKLKIRKHPNHVLYATNELLKKIAQAEKKLWMEPVEVPENPQRIITPTEGYDAMQTVITELKRIRRRLGVERLYDVENINDSKTPSDVLQNIEYAIKLFPTFDLKNTLVQYDRSSLKKSLDDVYSLSQFILEKVEFLKQQKGIQVEPKRTPMIYNLHTMHIYQKGIEVMEKINILREKEKLYQMSIPQSPTKQKSTDSIYELLAMVDSEFTIIMRRNGIKNKKNWAFNLDKKRYKEKTPSDIYNNIWKISALIDTIKDKPYTANETYVLAKKMELRISTIVKYLIGDVKIEHKKSFDKTSADVLNLLLELHKIVSKVENKANMRLGIVKIPNEQNITSDSVYNALRIINAKLVDINIHFGIETIIDDIEIDTTKTASDVYDTINKQYELVKQLLEDKNYED